MSKFRRHAPYSHPHFHHLSNSTLSLLHTLSNVVGNNAVVFHMSSLCFIVSLGYYKLLLPTLLESRSFGIICPPQTSRIGRCPGDPRHANGRGTRQISILEIQSRLVTTRSHSFVYARSRSTSTRIRRWINHHEFGTFQWRRIIGTGHGQWRSTATTTTRLGRHSTLVCRSIGITTSLFAEIGQYAIGTGLVETARTSDGNARLVVGLSGSNPFGGRILFGICEFDGRWTYFITQWGSAILLVAFT